MTCKDCIHYEACKTTASYFGCSTNNSHTFATYELRQEIEKDCADFKDKSRFIELPCKVGDTVYRTQGNYCGEKIFEGVVDQIAIFNNREIRIWVYGHPLGFGCDDIGKTVFLTEAIKEFENLIVNNLIEQAYGRDYLLCLIKEWAKEMTEAME